MQSFHELGVSSAVSQALAERDIHTPFAVQTLVVPTALRGDDVLAKAPTGSGKTLAFGVPLVERLEAKARPQALVLVPTRELCVQVSEVIEPLARAKGLAVAAVYGGTPLKGQRERVSRVDVVVATPGRLEDLASRGLDLGSVSILVLDEADRMLDMGFKPQVDKLVRRLPRRRQTMFFSATLDGEVADMARLYTHHPARFQTQGEDKGEVAHRFVPVSQADKVETLLRLIGEADDLTLVFTKTKMGAERLRHKLEAKGQPAAALHGDLSQRLRERTLARFERGEVKTLVATDVAARGLDLERIRLVVNYDPPQEAAGYTHRVGRTGRAGRSGEAVTLVLPEEQEEVSRLAALHGQKEEYASSGMKVARPRLVYSSRTGRSKWGKATGTRQRS